MNELISELDFVRYTVNAVAYIQQVTKLCSTLHSSTKKTWQLCEDDTLENSVHCEAILSYFRKFNTPQIDKLTHADFEYYSRVIHSSPPSWIVLCRHAAGFLFRTLHHSSSDVVLFSVMTGALLPEGLLLVEPRNLGHHEVLTLPGWRPSVVR